MKLLAGTFSIIFPQILLVVGCSWYLLPPGVARASHLSRFSVAEPVLMDPFPILWGNFLWEMRGDSVFHGRLKRLILFSVCTVSHWALWGKTKDVIKIWKKNLTQRLIFWGCVLKAKVIDKHRALLHKLCKKVIEQRLINTSGFLKVVFYPKKNFFSAFLLPVYVKAANNFLILPGCIYNAKLLS